MSEIEFIGLVEVYRRPQHGKAAALIVAVVLMAIVLVSGLLTGHFALLVVFVPFGAAIAGARRAAAPTEFRNVPMSMAVADGVLRVRMSGARLFDGRYADQFYLCSLGAIEGASFSEDGTFRLRARQMESFASDGGATIDHRTNEFSEVSFKVDRESQSRIQAFMAQFQGFGNGVRPEVSE